VKINQLIKSTPSFQVLSEDQIERLYFAALDVLLQTGLRLPDTPTARSLCAGRAMLSAQGQPRFQPALIREALRSHPEKVVVSGRSTQASIRLQKDEVHFGSGSSQPGFLERGASQSRPVTKDECERIARLVDGLPHFDLCSVPGRPGPSSSGYSDEQTFLALLEGCGKPLMTRTAHAGVLRRQWSMASCLRDEQELRRNPLFIEKVEPEAPLSPGQAPLDKLHACVDHGIPCLYSPGLIAGHNAPLSLAGVLVLALADCLAISVLSYLKGPGAPLIFGPRFGIAPDAESPDCLACPEVALLQAAFIDIAKWLRLPAVSVGGLTDACSLDERAAIDMVTGLYYGFLSGSNLVHEAGSLSSGSCLSLDGLVLCNEIIGMIKHIGRGISTDDEYLALDLIESIGPGGEYLTSEHTLEHFKEWFRPRLQDRSTFDDWLGRGSKSMLGRIEAESDRILSEHVPEPLDPDIREAMAASLRQ
jgi:trimethylamine--corrinoid protein Co-methyltransferase